MKVVIETGLYQEQASNRNPVYTTEIKSKAFGGRHFTLENLIKDKMELPSIMTSYGTNAKDRENVAKRYKITIEEV